MQTDAGCVNARLSCSMGVKLLRIAADTNVLLDLADDVEAVLDALAIIERRIPDTERLATPSVLDELAYL